MALGLSLYLVSVNETVTVTGCMEVWLVNGSRAVPRARVLSFFSVTAERK